ncbi:MAG: photosynthetic reaction center subunit H [Burkholderiales bacterium]|jgi:photosynthetic reaction center H subunit
MVGSMTGYIDVAQIVLYMFWIFFAGLIYYLHRENKREGYPLEVEESPNLKVEGFPRVPDPKTYLLRDGSTRMAPDGANTGRVADLKARAFAPHPGAPLEPTGNPMLDGVGPGAYNMRPDTPDMTVDGRPKIVPMRLASNFHLESRDPNPIGMNVIGGDGVVAGQVSEVWVDRAETVIRYFEVKVAANGKSVLLPYNFTKIGDDGIKVRSIFAHHFADVPTTKQSDSVTLLEEERIMAYYGAGTLYASADRAEPWI